jgi:hypothetical protein
LSCDGEALPSCSCEEKKTVSLGQRQVVMVKWFAYRLIGGLCGQCLCYIIIEAKSELLGIGIQEAFGNVRHWDGNQPVCFERVIG